MTQTSDVVQSYFSSVEDWSGLCSVPSQRDKVWKDECLYCHCTPLCNGGLYINMKSHQAFCMDHLRLDAANSEGLYLIETSVKVTLDFNGIIWLKYIQYGDLRVKF